MITPDGNRLNDGFTIFGNATLEEIEFMQVYDRWGELIWEGENFAPNRTELGWDGTFRGQPVNPAVFAWIARVRFVDGEMRWLTGDVTVVR